MQLKYLSNVDCHAQLLLKTRNLVHAFCKKQHFFLNMQGETSMFAEVVHIKHRYFSSSTAGYLTVKNMTL